MNATNINYDSCFTTEGLLSMIIDTAGGLTVFIVILAFVIQTFKKVRLNFSRHFRPDCSPHQKLGHLNLPLTLFAKCTK